MIGLPVLGNHRIYSKMKLGMTLNRLVATSHICNRNTNIFYFDYIYLHGYLSSLKPNIFSQFKAMILHASSLEDDEESFLPLQ